MEIADARNTPQRPQRLGILRRTLTSKSVLVPKRARSYTTPAIIPRAPAAPNPPPAGEEDPLNLYPRRARPEDLEDEEDDDLGGVPPAPPPPINAVESMEEFYLRSFKEGTATYEMLEDVIGPLAAQHLVYGGKLLYFHEQCNPRRI